MKLRHIIILVTKLVACNNFFYFPVWMKHLIFIFFFGYNRQHCGSLHYNFTYTVQFFILLPTTIFFTCCSRSPRYIVRFNSQKTYTPIFWTIISRKLVINFAFFFIIYKWTCVFISMYFLIQFHKQIYSITSNIKKTNRILSACVVREIYKLIKNQINVNKIQNRRQKKKEHFKFN